MRESATHPEFRFLLACCAQVPEPERQARVQQAFASPLDWNSVIAKAERHGVIPQVHRAVTAASATPAEVLHKAYADNCKRTLWFAAELARVTQHLRDRGVETLAYKGPVLSEVLYESVCERQYHDLDLIVQKNDVPAAKNALEELGYHNGLFLTSRQERAYLDTGYEYPLDHAYGKNLLELHWQIQARFYAMDFSIEDFFRRALPIQIGGQPSHTLCREDLMLVLCAHAAKHLWMRLSLLIDIAQLAQSNGLNWAAVQAQAAELGLQRVVAVSFLLAQHWLSCSLPEAVKPDQSTKSTAEDLGAIFARDDDFDVESPVYFRFMLQLRERQFDKARFLGRLLMTPGPNEWQAVQLPDALFPLYRVIRIGRLIRRFLPSTSRREPISQAR
jgi:hypothetical protein